MTQQPEDPTSAGERLANGTHSAREVTNLRITT